MARTIPGHAACTSSHPLEVLCARAQKVCGQHALLLALRSAQPRRGRQRCAVVGAGEREVPGKEQGSDWARNALRAPPEPVGGLVWCVRSLVRLDPDVEGARPDGVWRGRIDRSCRFVQLYR